MRRERGGREGGGGKERDGWRVERGREETERRWVKGGGGG